MTDWLRGICLLFGLALMSSITTATAGPVYTVTDIGTLGGTTAIPFGINDQGDVVGSSTTAGNAATHAFLFSNGQLKDLNPLGGAYSFASAINNAGQIVGGVTQVSGGHYRAFLYSNGTSVDLLGVDGVAYDINNHGDVTGYIETSNGQATRAYLYSNGQLTDLGTLAGQTSSEGRSINDLGQVAGNSLSLAFRTSPYSVINSATDALGTFGGSNSDARGINNLGQVVGSASLDHGLGAHAYLTGPNQPISSSDDLGALGGEYSSAESVNEAGQVVGSSNLGTIAFLYSDGKMIDLNSLIPSGSGVILTNATGINNKGQIIAMGRIGGDPSQRAFLLNPVVPEPSSFLLASFGLLASLGCGLRRRSSSPRRRTGSSR